MLFADRVDAGRDGIDDVLAAVENQKHLARSQKVAQRTQDVSRVCRQADGHRDGVGR